MCVCVSERKRLISESSFFSCGGGEVIGKISLGIVCVREREGKGEREGEGLIQGVSYVVLGKQGGSRRQAS